MARVKDDEHDRRGNVPLTSEVGSEGGSYAEPVIQRAVRGDEVRVIDRHKTTQAARGEDMAPIPQGAEDGVHFPELPGDELP